MCSTDSLLEDFCAWAVNDRYKQLSSYTTQRYRRYVETFLDTYGDPLLITPDDINEWKSECRDVGDTGSTINVKLSSLATFFGYVVAAGLRSDDPTRTVSKQRLGSRKPRFLSRAVMEKLFTAVYKESSLQDRAILEVLYGSGLRREEAGELRLANIAEKDKLRVIGKGDTERYTVITDPEFRALREHCIAELGDERTHALRVDISEDAAFDDLRKRKPQAPVFYTTEGRPLVDTADPGNYIWKRVRKYAQIVGENFTPHQFRHSFATHLLSEGVDLFKVSKMLGHRDIKTSTIYLGLEDKVFDEVRRAHPRSHAVPAWVKG